MKYTINDIQVKLDRSTYVGLHKEFEAHRFEDEKTFEEALTNVVENTLAICEEVIGYKKVIAMEFYSYKDFNYGFVLHFSDNWSYTMKPYDEKENPND